MKKYFAKYLPVEGNMLLVGEMYWNKQHNTADLVTSSFHLDILKKGNFQPAKLFLCSRDIQVGDKAYDENGNTCPFCNGYGQFPVESSVSDGFEECTICAREYKVIGEISPDATWVKEGDEFLGPEAGKKCEVFLIHDHDDETEEMIFTDKSGKKVDIPIYLIKGPCGHFH